MPTPSKSNDTQQLAPHLPDFPPANLNLDAIRAAHRLIAPHIHRTPVFTCSSLDHIAGAQLFFKCENLQKTGSFKIRGATNAVFSLTDQEAQLEWPLRLPEITPRRSPKRRAGAAFPPTS